MTYDLLIKNGTVVDGTGNPQYQADLALAGGRIVDIGKFSGHAKRVIDASDLIVAPGFVDPHTHYDAQICWDPLVSYSSWHGVTTVINGNCGVGVAPCQPTQHEVATWDLVNVEAIPFDVLKKGMTWDWESFPEYMASAERRGSAINLAFLAALTPFRHYVMGEESIERSATTHETSQIRGLLREAVCAGAFGFSTTVMPQHMGYNGRPLACRQASREEYRSYANLLRELGRGVIQLALTRNPTELSSDEYEFLDFLLTESGRPVSWLAVLDRDDKPGAGMKLLSRAEPLINRGAVPQTTCMPFIGHYDLKEPFIFGIFPSWRVVFDQPVEAQKKIYTDPRFRQTAREEFDRATTFRPNWDHFEIREVSSGDMKSLEGKTVAEIARERGKDPLDTFFDVAVEDDLNTVYCVTLFNTNDDRVSELITDPRTLIGLSDGGAHVDQECGGGYCTYLLGTWVREKQAMSLEYAVKRITSEPASYFGISDRGRLATGFAGDVVIFDYDTVGSSKRGNMRYDLPGGARRLVMEAQGIRYTIVNGQVLYENGQHTGALPGRVLRLGA